MSDLSTTKRSQSNHEQYLRRAFDVARQSLERGDHPFGAILVGPDGECLHEQGNGFSSEGRDMTAHAERLLATWASKHYSPDFLAGCTLYSSAEPCAMCAGAIYWSGIGCVVFGQTERSLKALTGKSPENPTLDIPCRDIFAKGQRHIEVIGPLLEAEAIALHANFWVGRDA
ncbi:MAG TPA: nucleoside deaminase [Xanthobacteraceae bacterium]|nr:nucleoside deaminase [Xanthobacteraceae bacterium]